MHEFLKLFVVDMSCFVHAPELLEVIERNKGGTNLVSDPVVCDNVIEFIQIEICRALVERFRHRLNNDDIVKHGGVVVDVLIRDVQKRVFPGPSFPLLDDLQRPFILPGVDFQTQGRFRIVAGLSEIFFVYVGRNCAKGPFFLR